MPTILSTFILCASMLCVHSVRIIDYQFHHNDTRIDWKHARPLMEPFDPCLYIWWGDEAVELEAFDLMTRHSGVPVTGSGSLWPTRGTPVMSVLGVTNGPLKVPLWIAQEALEKGTWNPSGKIEISVEKRRRPGRPRFHLRSGGELVIADDSSADEGDRHRPATLEVEFFSSAHEEISLPAFSQESLGDVIARIVRRNPQTADCRMLLTMGKADARGDGGGVGESLVAGLPWAMGGVPLEARLAELGYGDGDKLVLVGVWTHESSFPRYQVVRHAVEAFLNQREWPPCKNLGRQEPLNYLVAGDTSHTAGSEPEMDNQPKNLVVLVSDSGRICFNKHALWAHLDKEDTNPVNGKKADRHFKTQVKASLMMDVAYMPIYASEELWLQASQKESLMSSAAM